MHQGPLVYTLLPKLVISCLLDDSCSNVSERWYFIGVMICISLIISDDKYLFMYLLAIWKSSLKKCLFHFPSHFFSCIVWFFIELQKFFLFILILYQIYYSQQFSPILWVPFLLWWLFLLFYRAFLFDTVPLVEFCFYCLCFWCHIHIYNKGYIIKLCKKLRQLNSKKKPTNK